MSAEFLGQSQEADCFDVRGYLKTIIAGVNDERAGRIEIVSGLMKSSFEFGGEAALDLDGPE